MCDICQESKSQFNIIHSDWTKDSNPIVHLCTICFNEHIKVIVLDERENTHCLTCEEKIHIFQPYYVIRHAIYINNHCYDCAHEVFEKIFKLKKEVAKYDNYF